MTDIANRIVGLTLVRPEQLRNPRSDVLNELITALDRSEAAPGSRNVILWGTGQLALPAGSDLPEFALNISPCINSGLMAAAEANHGR
jgi:enoyl-CoA hydratase/carnithine racemase